MKRKLLIISLTALLMAGCGNEITEKDIKKVETNSQSVTVSSDTQTSPTETSTQWSVSLHDNPTTTAASSASEQSSSQTSGEASETNTTDPQPNEDTQSSATAQSAETTPSAVTTTSPQTTTAAVSTTTPAATTTRPTTTTTRPVYTSDTTKPTLFNYGSGSYHIAGTPFDLKNYVGYGDDTDRDPKLTYTGYIDPNKVGDYELHATVTDASGNSSSWALNIHVVNKIPTSSYTTASTEPLKFADFIAKHKASNTRFGIDVSQWQGAVDYNAVKNAGCSFVFIRVGTKYDSYTLDPYFKTNLNNAIAAGLDVGVYLYTTDHTEAAARDSARWIASQLGGKKLTLPVAFDWEELRNFQKFGASINDINNAYSAFKSELSKYGLNSMIYGNLTTLNSLWSPSVKNSSPVWLACFRDNPGYYGSYGIWQVGYGRIPGIGGNTDFNVLYTDKKYK